MFYERHPSECARGHQLDFDGRELLMRDMTMAGQSFIRAQKAALARAGMALGLLLCLALASCSSTTSQVHTFTPAAPQFSQGTPSIPPNTQPAANRPSPAQSDYRIQPLDT